MASISIIDDDVLVSTEVHRAKRDPEVLGPPCIESEASNLMKGADPPGSATRSSEAATIERPLETVAAAAPAGEASGVSLASDASSPVDAGVEGSQLPTPVKRSREDDQASCEDEQGHRKRPTLAGISGWRDALALELQQRMDAAMTSHEMEAIMRSSDLHADFTHCAALHSRVIAHVKSLRKQREAAVMAKGKAICSDPQHFLNHSKIKSWTLLQKFYSSNKHLMTMQTCVDFDKRLEARVLAWKRVLKEYYDHSSSAKKEALRVRKDAAADELAAAEASDRCPDDLPKLEKKLTRLESKIERLEAAAGLSESNAFDVILNVFVSRKNFVMEVEGDFSARAEAWMQCLHRDVMNEVTVESCDDRDADFDVESELTRLLQEDQ